MTYRISRKFFFLIILLSHIAVDGVALAVSKDINGFSLEHPDTIYAGEPFLVKVTSEALSGTIVRWRGKNIPLDGNGAQAEIMLSVPLGANAGSLPLLVLSGVGNKVYAVDLEVRQREYPSQTLNVEPRYVNPAPEDLKRIENEAKVTREILLRITPLKSWQLPLHKSVPGGITSEFGFRRVYNGELRGQHRGIDFRGAEGSPVKAVAGGRVVQTADFYYSGVHVIIDHGLGVFSLYAHLQECKTFAGKLVEAGEVIGLVGKTGRVTGPHLHFGFYVLGEAVTPEPFMPGLTRVMSAPDPKPAPKTSSSAPPDFLKPVVKFGSTHPVKPSTGEILLQASDAAVREDGQVAGTGLAGG